MFSRREFLAYGAIAASSVLTGAPGDVPECDGVPCVDYHVHVGNELSIDQAVRFLFVAASNSALFSMPASQGKAMRSATMTDCMPGYDRLKASRSSRASRQRASIGFLRSPKARLRSWTMYRRMHWACPIDWANQCKSGNRIFGQRIRRTSWITT